MKDLLTLVSALAGLLLTACTLTSNGDKAEEGYVKVTVIDEQQQPVEAVEIYLVRDSTLKVTGKNGTALFTAAPGDYFIDARVCCRGPAFINYHEAVKVVKKDTAKKTLNACLSCL